MATTPGGTIRQILDMQGLIEFQSGNLDDDVIREPRGPDPQHRSGVQGLLDVAAGHNAEEASAAELDRHFDQHPLRGVDPLEVDVINGDSKTVSHWTSRTRTLSTLAVHVQVNATFTPALMSGRTLSAATLTGTGS